MLEKINKLFPSGVGKSVDLPQIVVVGDQSSRKSSILEGLVKEPLPCISELCTCFGTQIVFCQAGHRQVPVFIMSDRIASSEDSARVKAWERAVSSLDSDTFKAIMEDDFLQRQCTVIHISGGQPMREPGFFFMTWCNMQRQRRITLRHQKVMIHLQYHKSQRQTGQLRENIRFLAHPVSNLPLNYLVYVQALRRTFLR